MNRWLILQLHHTKIGPWVLCCFKEVGSEVFLMGTQETSFIVWFSQYQPLFFKVTTIVVTVIWIVCNNSNLSHITSGSTMSTHKCSLIFSHMNWVNNSSTGLFIIMCKPLNINSMTMHSCCCEECYILIFRCSYA